MSNPAPFPDRLAQAVNARMSVACVGIDPVLDRLPAELLPEVSSEAGSAAALLRFSTGVVDAVRDMVPVVKFQSACFERFGAHGVASLHASIAHAKAAGLLVILDAKRGDIGVTAAHYAAAAFDDPKSGADALTVNGYLGADTIEPFLRPDRGVFVLVRTSNPGSDRLQSLPLGDGRTVAEAMADIVRDLGESRRGRSGLSSVGAVVGATKSGEAAALRRRMPDSIFLVPGYGAQGGTLEDVRPALRDVGASRQPSQLGVLVTASRSLTYPDVSSGAGAEGWKAGVEANTQRLVRELRALH